MEFKEVKLPSGAILKIGLAPFSDSNNLLQAILAEFKGLQLDPLKEVDPNLFKDIFCVGFSSKEIERCVWQCMKRCLYNSGKADLKIDESTFESEESRQDYFTVMLEVAKANVMPFMKSLYAQYSQVLGLLKKDHA